MADRTSGRGTADIIARAVREVVHQTPAPTREDRVSHLVAARELERFHLGAERVDIRSWSVLSSDGRLVGVVDRLLVEAATGRVRYASVVLAPLEASEEPTAPGSVLVPVGSIRQNADRRLVVLDDLTSEDLARAPRLPRRAITRADEDATLTAYGIATSREIPRGQMYTRPHFDERRLLAAAE